MLFEPISIAEPKPLKVNVELEKRLGNLSKNDNNLALNNKKYKIWNVRKTK